MTSADAHAPASSLEQHWHELVTAALLFPLEIGTGSDVRLNGATLLLIALLALWALMMVVRRRVHVLPSRVNLPLLLFVASGLVSFAVGRLLWDPAVPIKSTIATAPSMIQIIRRVPPPENASASGSTVTERSRLVSG